MDQSLEREIRRLYAGYHSPGDPQGRSFVPLADAYRRAGDLLRARLLLEEGLRRHPDFSSAYVVAMRIARDVSDHAGALAATRRVLELDPDNVEARRVLAEIGPLPEAGPSPQAPASRDEGETGLPDESWMAGAAGAWSAGTDSGLASVDPVALEAEEKHTAARRAEEKRHAARAQVEREAPREAERQPGTATSSGASDSAADAGIYTRTMGRLYEQQGLHSQAIAVYERILESEPGDDAIASRLEILRRQAGGDAAGKSSAERDAEGDAAGAGSADPGAPETGDRFAAAGEEAAPSRKRDAVRSPDAAPHDDLPVVPIEALAPDATTAGLSGEAP